MTNVRDRAYTRGLVPCFLVILLLTVDSATARSWDLAVTVGKEIDFIMQNGSLIGKTIIAEAPALVGMAYDDDTYTMFLSDPQNRNFSIYSVDLSAKNVTTKPILKKDTDSQVQRMAFDSQTRTLFWTTEKAIMKMRIPITGSPGEPVLLHKLDNESQRSIALDVCNRHIYWTNSKPTNPSIMRSDFDGANLTTIITENLYEPSSIVVDHTNSRLYWIDDEEGIHYKLEQSNLDGSERAILVHGKHQEPVHLAVDRDNLYWTDFVYRAIWTIGKNVKAGDVPKSFKSYFDSNRQADPTTILTRDNLGSGIDCKVMKAEKKKIAVLAAPTPTVQSFNNLTTSTEVADQEAENCFNGGVYDRTAATCQCKPGFSGSRCEISSCHNYCLRGECFVDNKGMPVCKCGASYSGVRCEHDVCDGYCLNNGRCYIDNGKPNCECKYSSGVRCEVTYDMAEICALYCMNRQLQVTSIDTSSCRCTELNHTIEEVLGYDTFNCTILVPLLSAFVGMLTIIVIFLSVYVSKLRRRPRIKKRFVVNKGGITPLTSRPSQLPGDQCEITIENCCNMNICETPCFEPKLRTTNARSNGMKKEEKNGLLNHMEGDGNSF